MACHYKLTGF